MHNFHTSIPNKSIYANMLKCKVHNPERVICKSFADSNLGLSWRSWSRQYSQATRPGLGHALILKRQAAQFTAKSYKPFLLISITELVRCVYNSWVISVLHYKIWFHKDSRKKGVVKNGNNINYSQQHKYTTEVYYKCTLAYILQGKNT